MDDRHRPLRRPGQNPAYTPTRRKSWDDAGKTLHAQDFPTKHEWPLHRRVVTVYFDMKNLQGEVTMQTKLQFLLPGR